MFLIYFFKYWREFKDSYDFLYCENNPSVCLGNDVCEEGYTGLLCENCDKINGFSMESSSNKCKKCENNKMSIILEMFLIFLLFCLFIFN